VRRDGDTIVIEGLGRIPIAQALQMAHRIADEATP
jgi:hypothetical protein